MRDALPLLRMAADVTVFSAHDGDGRAHATRSLTALASYLGSHGIRSRLTTSYGSRADIGQMVLAQAKHVGADVLVIGAAARRRRRKLMLGASAETVLAGSPIPVLLQN